MKTIKDANFICPDADFGEICPVFKKVVWIDKPVVNARLYISAVGSYEAYFNENRVGKFIFAPGYTSYNTRLQYQEYNVTRYLEECNVIDVAVGKFRHCHNNEKLDIKSNETALICALVVDYEDGTSDFIPTDDTWECTKSNVLYSNVYKGEIVDFTTDTEEKFHIKIVHPNKYILIPTEGEEIREITRLSPLSIFKTPKNEWVIDFGQNISGYVEWVVPKKKGKAFTIYHGEILTPDGNFYNENLRSAKAKIKVISDGNERIYKPHFTYQGFRYIKLEGFEEKDIKEEKFSAIVVFSDMKRTGFFACGNDDIQQIYENALWSQRGNFIDIPTNCPQRDDSFDSKEYVNSFCRAASINYNTNKFFCKWLHDLKENSVVTAEASCENNYNEGSICSFGDASVIVPYWMYRTYNNKKIIEEQFDSMKKWIDFMESNGSEKGLFDSQNDNYADKFSLEKVETDKSLIATAFLAYSNSLFIKMGKVIGKDMTYYEELYTKTVEQYRKNYLNTGKPQHETQTALTLALYFNLTEDRNREGNKLIEDIEKCGHLKTGVMGTPYILHTLKGIGRVDLAYSLLLKKTYPSWIYPVTKGATTIWERWNSINEDGSFNDAKANSLNSFALGSVVDFLYTSVAGIDSDFNEPSYKHIILRPFPIKELGYAKARILTEYGEIVSSWEYTGKGNECKFSFTIPKNCYGTLYLDNEEYEFHEGTYTTCFDYEG